MDSHDDLTEGLFLLWSLSTSTMVKAGIFPFVATLSRLAHGGNSVEEAESNKEAMRFPQSSAYVDQCSMINWGIS